jgi:EF-hand domain pair
MMLAPTSSEQKLMKLSALIAGLMFATGATLAFAQTDPATPPQAPAPGAAPNGQPQAPGMQGPHRHHRHGGMFKRIDTDGDGMISRAELLASQQRQLQAFERADTNHDGKLSRDEMRAFFRSMHGKRGAAPGSDTPASTAPRSSADPVQG